jgi:hypothetical protein
MGQIPAAAPQPSRSKSFRLRLIAEIIVASIGTALLVCMVVTNQGWLDSHFVPSFFLPCQTYVAPERTARVVMAIVGVWLVFVARQRAGRLAAQAPRRTFEILIAARRPSQSGSASSRRNRGYGESRTQQSGPGKIRCRAVLGREGFQSNDNGDHD